MMDDSIFLVAVSGGPDSMALLDMLRQQGKKLVVAHINYKTRPESDTETDLVSKYCQTHKIPFEYKIVDYYLKGNFQNFARVERFRFFKEIYIKYQASGLYVAHHLDDALETYLMQKNKFLRAKKYGIAAETIIMDMKVLRPLLKLTKNDLLQYCIDKQVPYALDSSNLIPKYTRNMIRLKVLDKMTKEEKESLIRAMENDQKIIEEENKAVLSFLKENCVGNKIRFAAFILLDSNFQTQVLRCWLANYIGEKAYSLSKKWLLDILNQLLTIRPNIMIEIPHEFILVKEYEEIKIIQNQRFVEYQYLIKEPHICLQTEYFKVQKSGQVKEEIIASLSDYPLVIRTVQPGDVIMTKNGHKQVRRLFIDRKIPKMERTKYPIVVNKDGIVILIPGLYQNYLNNNLQTGQFVVKSYSDT